MKYLEFFKEVKYFSNGSYVVGGWYDKNTALEMIKKESGISSITENMIEENRVKFGYAPYFVENHEEFDNPVWYTGANGKGSMTVWEYDQWRWKK